MKKSASRKNTIVRQKNAAFIFVLIGVLGAGLFLNQVLASGDNSVLSVQRLDQFDNTKYSLTLEDPEDIGAFLINKAGGESIWGGEPSCSTSITSDTVTLGPSDFPLSGYVIDCENTNVQNSVQASMPPLPISGHKFYDANSSGGAKDDDDPGIEGWSIILLDENGDEEDSTNTNGEYLYEFNELPDGTYIVCENTEQNWTQTYPTADDADDGAVSCNESEGYAPWGWEVIIENGEIINDLESFDFGNTPKLGAISVVKFNDRNNDRVRNEGEPGIEDIEFRLNDDGLADDFLRQLYSYFLPEDFDRFTRTNMDGLAEWGRRLPAGSYEIEEQEAGENGWISTTDTNQAVQLNPVVNENAEVMFGNRRPALIVYKYDDETGNLIPGWEICLYKEASFALGEKIECKETIDDYDEENEEPGRFHGAAVFSLENLQPNQEEQELYIIDEEEKAGWRLENVDGYYQDVISRDLGQVLVWFDDESLAEEDAELYLYNSKFTGDITAFKYFGENKYAGSEFPVRGYEICLHEFDEETGALGSEDCKDTDPSGMVSWQNVLPGMYVLDEEEREEWGWEHRDFYVGRDEVEWNQELGQARVHVREGGNVVVNFYNWVNDQSPPHSFFEDSMEHRVIDTEIVSLELRGTSVDDSPVLGDKGEILLGSSGIHNATSMVRQLAGSEAVADYPSRSFFDVFTELRCPNSENIPIEIVSLSLTGVDPIVAWNTEVDLGKHGPGIYCFEVGATDNAGNPEETGYAGPVAYVPVVQITEESTSVTPPTQTSFAVTWTTDEPATSRVIYDSVSHEDEALGEEPNYGYAFSTEEQDLDPNKVTEHSVTITGLTQGTTYYYRTVSKASPASVGPEGSVTTASDPVPASSGGGGGGGGGGSTPPPPTEPAGGFKFFITPEVTEDGAILLNFDGGPDAEKIAIADNPNFSPATYINYTTSIVWTLSGISGERTLYVKFSNQYVQYSKVISDTVVYAPKEISQSPAPASHVSRGSTSPAPIQTPLMPEPREEAPTVQTVQTEQETQIAQAQPTPPQPVEPQPLMALAISAVTIGTESVVVGALIVALILGSAGYGMYAVIQRMRRKNLGKLR